MRSRPGDSSKVSAEEPDAELRPNLLRLLRAEVGREIIASVIHEFLSDPKNKGLRREAFSAALAKHLASKWLFVPSGYSPLKRLVENRPAELGALIKFSGWDDLQRLAEKIRLSPKQKRFRAKIESDKQRKKRNAASKNRYDRLRRNRRTALSLIEAEFGERVPGSIEPSDTQVPSARSLQKMLFSGAEDAATHNRDVWSTGSCLDEVMKGGEVPMAGSYSCLENLFGRARKRLPSGLPHRREGRHFLYDYRAVLECVEALLGNNSPGTRWLKDPFRRRVVLTGIMKRAFEKATPEIRAAFILTLSRHMR